MNRNSTIQRIPTCSISNINQEVSVEMVNMSMYSPQPKIDTFLVWSKFVKSVKVWLAPCVRFFTEIFVQKGLF